MDGASAYSGKRLRLCVSQLCSLSAADIERREQRQDRHDGRPGDNHCRTGEKVRFIAGAVPPLGGRRFKCSYRSGPIHADCGSHEIAEQIPVSGVTPPCQQIGDGQYGH